MRYAIRHETRFTYADPVNFARCNLRLRPIDWEGQRLIDFALSVEPGGELTDARADTGLVNVTRLVVPGIAREIVITAAANVEVTRAIPVAGDRDPSVADIVQLARTSRDSSARGPANYLYPTPMVPLDPAIAAWCAADLADEANVLGAGIALARRIKAEFEFDPDATKTETRPAEAFAKRRGVCQDFAQIMISGLRSAGLPAAYASGYLRTTPPPGRARLIGADATHAWVLLWCGPERGWVGLDPTNGSWMAGDHIVVAVGRDYADVAPIDGIFMGYGAQEIDVAVDVEPAGEMAA